MSAVGIPVLQGGEEVNNRPAEQRGAPPGLSDDNLGVIGYHGTDADFEEFDPAKIGSATDAGLLGAGFYFSTDPEVGRSSARTLERRLLIERPLVLRCLTWEVQKGRLVRDALGLAEGATAEEVTAAVLANGYDSVILDYTPLGYRHQEMVVFNVDRIRPAMPRATGAAPTRKSDVPEPRRTRRTRFGR